MSKMFQLTKLRFSLLNVKSYKNVYNYGSCLLL